MEIDFANRLHDAGVALGLSLSQTQTSQLIAYVNQLQRWNRVYNLTAIRQAEQMLSHHIIDSLAVVPYLDRLLDKKPVSENTVVDVGSGAGLPGLVLAIMRPWTIHCVDAVEKKISFIRHAAGHLKLSNVVAHHARIESLPSLHADVVISRAFSSLIDFARLAANHLTEGGSLIAMKGNYPEEEVVALEAGGTWCVGECHTIAVPELDAQRCVLRLCLKD